MTQERKKTPHSDFLKFRRECERMIKVLGLQEWSVTFAHADCGDAFADIGVCHPGRVAHVRFNLYHDATGETEAYDPVRVARHEMLELLLSPLVRLANARSATEMEVETATHAIIRRLERKRLPD